MELRFKRREPGPGRVDCGDMSLLLIGELAGVSQPDTLLPFPAGVRGHAVLSGVALSQVGIAPFKTKHPD